jgi:hypothetical protein
MNGGRFCPSQACCGAIPQSEPWLTVRGIIACLLTVALMDIFGCARNEPVQKSDSPIAIETPATPAPQPPIELNQAGRSLPAEPHLLEGSGVTVWAKESQGQSIAGLDGALYDPYRQATIESVQKALRDRGLYPGPVNGILDRPTMKSIYAFQEANDNLQRCGVPTPHTRQMLMQGSHTDLSS